MWRRARAARAPHHLVLSDIVMLRMGGDAMLRAMQQECRVAANHEELKVAPEAGLSRCDQPTCEGAGACLRCDPVAVACTGNVSEEDLARYLQLGFWRVLPKPFSRGLLESVLAEFAKKSTTVPPRAPHAVA